MRLPSARRAAFRPHTVAKLRAEIDAARNDIRRLRHERATLIAQRDAVRGEREEAIRERDRAVADLHCVTASGSPDSSSDLSEYVVVPRWRALDYPRIAVETDATNAAVSKMCGDLAASWSAMGESEPFFTNVAHDKFKMQNIADSKEELFRSGCETLREIEAIAQRQGIDLRAYKDCFELGCGVGRVMRALTSVFDTVYGMDISAGHLRVARDELAAAPGRFELRKFDDPSSIETLPPFDVFVSFYVLQHNPPPVAANLLDRILAKVRVGGVACFQCQTYQVGYRFVVGEYEHTNRDQYCAPAGCEMHCLPQHVIYEIFGRNGFSLLEVREDGALADGISQVFFAIRTSEDARSHATRTGHAK
jgi:SAM-dependent methyltransferase